MDYKAYQEKLHSALKIGRQTVVVDDMPDTVKRLAEDEIWKVWRWAEARRVVGELEYQLMNAYWPRTDGPRGMLEAAGYLADHPEEAADFFREVSTACWASGMAESEWDVMGAAAENWLSEREQ